MMGFGTFLPLLKFRSLTLVMLLFIGGMQASHAESGTAGSAPAIKDLGNGRYRIGAIELDKTGRRFKVPGVILPVEGPLEYLAVTKGGVKAYEALLELEVNAIEFNTACILIGLETKNAVLPKFHFDPAPVSGDPVMLTVSWEHDGQRVETPALGLLRQKQAPFESEKWVYTGSTFTPDNQYLAEMDGTLVGFVHDPAAIIEHHIGLGLGDYGAITGNPEVLPPPGTNVVLTVVNP